MVSLGVLFLLDSAGALDADTAIDHWWPLAIIAAGALTLAKRPPSVFRGLLLIAVGGVVLLFTTNLLDGDPWAFAWPVALMVVGLAIVVRWTGRIPSSAGPLTGDVVRSTAIFGAPKLISTAQRFRGAWLTAIFGGATLDLRAARPAPEGASINATVAFGGIDILVPPGWRVTVRSLPIFGGLEDETEHAEPLADDAPLVHIDAVILFGGVQIKHET